MNAVLTVARKEVFDNLRDRRTMLSTLAFGPVFAPVLFFIMMQIVVDRAVQSGEERLSVPIVGIETAPNLEDHLAGRRIDAATDHELTSLDSAASAVRDGRHRFAVVIEDSFRENLAGSKPARVTIVFDRSNSRDTDSIQRLQSALRDYAERIGSLRLLARGISPSVVRPVIVDGYDLSTPTSRSAVVLGILTYFLLFSVLMGGMYLAIDTTAGERERRSLEPLLTTPVSRTELLLGKVAATVAFMLVSLVLTLTAFAIGMPYLPLGELGMSSGFGPRAALFAFFVLMPFALLGAFVLTIVASYTKTYKEAQTWLGLLLIVPTLPVAIATMLNIEPSQALMWIPSMSQHLLITSMIRQDTVMPLMLVQSILSTLLYAGLLALLSIRLYKREALLG